MSDGALVPRLCHVRKWPDFSGYGFNLHAEKGRAGQFIGKVDAASPAEEAGLKEGDRIVEVNGTNISNENHAQVVQRIKAVPNETKLLVVDTATDEKYKEEKIVVRGDLPEVSSRDSGTQPGEGREVTQEVVAVTETSPPAAAAHGYKARLCHLRIWPDFQGYGFNLHAEKNKPGQYIGKVDEGSPADAAGLREGDKIVEVNGDNISTSNHQGVVSKIKMNAKEAKLLVMDAEALAYFEREGLTITSQSACVEAITCPEVPRANGTTVTQVEVTKVEETPQVNGEPEPEDSAPAKKEEEAEPVVVATTSEPPVSAAPQMNDAEEALNAITAAAEEGEKQLMQEKAPQPVIPEPTSPTPPKSPVVIDGIEFAGSAKEARLRMSRKKNVKDTSVSMKEKFDQFQRL